MKIGSRRLKLPELPGLPRLKMPQPKSRAGKIARGILPLLLIAIGVYVLYNFPALKDRLLYMLHPPKPGNIALLPSTVKAESEIPVGDRSACGTQPIGYEGNGTPKLICDNYIYIPKIRVGAPIVWPKQTDDVTINNSLLAGVVHYPGTAEPGQRGNVFLTGHSSYYWWVNSDFKTVFTLVPQLVGGDEIVIYNRGIRYTYRVSEVYDVAPTQTSVLAPTPEPVITLSTCVPIGTAYRRRIVRAVQISPDPQTARAIDTSTHIPVRLPGVR